MAEASTNINKKMLKDQDPKKASISPKCHIPKKQNRKGENPIRIPPITEPCSDKCSNSWICKNSACRAVVSIVDTFCKRCSCCICHLFDDNKDPSLWFECTSEYSDGESCGLSCHIECALQHRKVGVVDLGQLMQLDGSYCCGSCGKVSGILRYWKRQLTIAKDARRVDSLCYRINLSFRLFNGTLRFQELHTIVTAIKTKLETELGPMSGVSAKMARGISSRLSVAGEVQALCHAAIEKADEYSATAPCTSLNEDSLPAACKFIFEEVTPSSIVLLLIDPYKTDDIIGYKLYYSKTTDTENPKDPIATFPKSQRRIHISNLHPCTEYSFRIIPYTKTTDLGHFEAKCFTKNIDIIHNNATTGPVDIESDSGFKVRDLGKILRLAWAKEQGYLDDILIENSHIVSKSTKPETSKSGDLDLNVAPVVDSDHSSGASENWEVPAVDSSRKRRVASETHDCDSTLVNGSLLTFEENFEYCVKIIRWLECQGYIKQEFRLKLLTWFSLKSTDQERRVVNTFIQTLIDDPGSLAGQLVHSFGDIINNKRPRNGFCSKLWH